ncbi:MAG: hypothetical protein IT492_18575 [Gammaproteobacteria bacterium]|nr:hypothetical protein [Gammaproteobacteria bacterium]
MSTLLSAPDLDAAQELLHASGCTDGLPVIVPTVDKVARMVLASGLDADIVLGDMGPAYGVATVEKVAVAAVMAGCVPDVMPVVIAAVRAVCQSAFDLTEVQCTTHCIAPLVIVNGPARTDCGGFASGFGLMGPGHRANATVGRALRLAMMNIGGARPGVSDMAIHGSPAKFTFCIAEDEDASPFPPLHTSFGYDAKDSVVTVVGVDSPHSTFFTGDADDPASAEALLDTLAAVIASPGNNNSQLGGKSAVVVVLNPDHAEVLKRAQYDRTRIQQTLAARAVTPRELLIRLNPKMLVGREAMIPAVRKPANIHVLVAGGPGLYSMVMPSWCAGPHGNIAVHEKVETSQFCELPVHDEKH